MKASNLRIPNCRARIQSQKRPISQCKVMRTSLGRDKEVQTPVSLNSSLLGHQSGKHTSRSASSSSPSSSSSSSTSRIQSAANFSMWAMGSGAEERVTDGHGNSSKVLDNKQTVFNSLHWLLYQAEIPFPVHSKVQLRKVLSFHDPAPKTLAMGAAFLGSPTSNKLLLVPHFCL